ncbi:hypothetical protein [Fusobacterium varium]|uniref:hypothetical protein n=1 Tax=Fusobacterium varium TaxID=856 RepID=UPI003F015D7C
MKYSFYELWYLIPLIFIFFYYLGICIQYIIRKISWNYETIFLLVISPMFLLIILPFVYAPYICFKTLKEEKISLKLYKKISLYIKIIFVSLSDGAIILGFFLDELVAEQEVTHQEDIALQDRHIKKTLKDTMDKIVEELQLVHC